jgi:hypothetical protein
MPNNFWNTDGSFNSNSINRNTAFGNFMFRMSEDFNPDGDPFTSPSGAPHLERGVSETMQALQRRTWQQIQRRRNRRS